MTNINCAHSSELLVPILKDCSFLEEFPLLGEIRKDVTKTGKTKTKKTSALFKATSIPTPTPYIKSGEMQGKELVGDRTPPISKKIGEQLGSEGSSTGSEVGYSNSGNARNIILRRFKNPLGANVCFANSSMVTLMNSSVMDIDQEEGIQGHIKSFLKEDIVHDVYPLLQKIDEEFPDTKLSNNTQEDPADLIGKILRSIQSNIPSSDLLMKIIETTKCLSCGDVKHMEDKGYIYNMKSKYFTADVRSTLEKCLQGDVEELCDSCKTVQRIKYETLVTNAPDTLYLCAVRYNYISGNAYKIKKNIHPSDIVEISGVKYKLRSIIVHDGETVNSGHYYTLLPDPADPLIFHKLDDERISKIKILDHKGDGYIFTYVKLTDVSLLPQKHSKLPSYSEVLARVQPDNSEASKCRSIPSLSKEIPILKGNQRKSIHIF